MNVTYLIGNGFDIACGLKTRFTDFVKEYLSTITDDTDICSFMSLIQQDLCTWADAEYAFGQLTQNINNVKQFKKCYRDFIKQLKQYLQAQQNVLNGKILKKEKMAFIRGLKSFQRFLVDEPRREFESCVNGMDTQTIQYNFLVFNYTEVFENLLKRSLAELSGNLGKVDLFGKDCDCILGNTIYVHGSLASPPIIFGVNDTEQIRYLLHKENPDMAQILIKPVANKELSPDRFNNCLEIIRQSDIICSYGMSIGLTDSIWWNEILNWLAGKENANFIIHYWEPECDFSIADDVMQTIKDCKKKFISNSKSNTRTYKSLKDRIHVVINQNPFHIVMHAQ